MEQERKMLIYFAGPLFSEAEKQFNLQLSGWRRPVSACSCPKETVWRAASRPTTA
jgi:hypothetical protein